MAELKSEKDQLNALESLFQQKRFSDALEVAKKASSDYPNSYQIKFLYVRTLKELNKLAEAEEVLKELMLIFPNNINLLLESGNLAVLRNKFDEGNEFYNKILFLDPFNTEAKTSIEKINMIKKGGLPGKAIKDSLSPQNKNLQSADTLPEFDSTQLRDILNEEPPPPPTPPPTPEVKKGPINEQERELFPSPLSSLPEMEEIPEVDAVDTVETVDKEEETWSTGLSREKLLEQEMNQNEMPQPIYKTEEMNHKSEEVNSLPSPPDMEAEIPVYEVPPIPGLTTEPEEIEEPVQEEFLQPLTGKKGGSSSFPIPEADPGLTVVPPPVPDETEVSDIPDIPETPIEMEQEWEAREPEEVMQEVEAPWREEQDSEETGFVTESAAQLYVKQGLLDDALVIYKKLYDSRKEERFLAKIKELRPILVRQKKIRVLNELLQHLKLIGEKIV